jgi:hypothetical protein
VGGQRQTPQMQQTSINTDKRTNINIDITNAVLFTVQFYIMIVSFYFLHFIPDIYRGSMKNMI